MHRVQSGRLAHAVPTFPCLQQLGWLAACYHRYPSNQQIYRVPVVPLWCLPCLRIRVATSNHHISGQAFRFIIFHAIQSKTLDACGSFDPFPNGLMKTWQRCWYTPLSRAVIWKDTIGQHNVTSIYGAHMPRYLVRKNITLPQQRTAEHNIAISYPCIIRIFS